jgi:hypothetical protein
MNGDTRAQVAATPSVMLSPKATTRVTVKRGGGGGGGETTTGNAQLAVRCWASRAVQVTVVDPIGKAAPTSGVHVVATG